MQYLYIRCGVDTPYIPIPLPTPWALFIHPSYRSTTACDLPNQPATVPLSSFIFHHRQLHLVTLDQTPAKCILLVQCAALPWMVQAKLVRPVELYVTYSLTFFFGSLCHVHCTEAGGDCDEGGKRGSVFFNFKGEDDPNECKKKLCTLRSHFFYLSSSFSILARVVPGSCTCVRSSAE